MKKLETLVADIYRLLETKEVPDGVNLDAAVDSFGLAMADVLRTELTKKQENRGLRLSGIGKPNRRVYLSNQGIQGEPFDGPTFLKFLYGHLTEALVLALTQIAGHTVTEQQKEVDVAGVKGHIDAYVDGVLIDVKSCSSYSFKKFQKNTLHEDDSFGYIPQLRAYAFAEGQQEFGWIAFDKQNGTLSVLTYNTEHEDPPYAEALEWSVPERVLELQGVVASDTLPPLCFDPVPFGKSGNEVLARGCNYCEFKHHCFPELRTYIYSTGPKYFTKVVKDPRAMEIPDEF